MKVFLALLKADLLRLFGINKAFHSGKGGRKLFGIIAIALFVGLFIVVQAAAYTGVLALAFPEGSKYKALSLIVLAYFAIMLIMSAGTAKTVFGCMDYDMLSSLPVRPVVMVLSKLAYVYIVDFLFAFAFIVPSSAVYGFFVGSVAISSLTALLSVFFFPLVPMTIGLMVGTLLGYLSARIKYKNITRIVFSVVFILVYCWFVFGVQNVEAGAVLTFLNSAYLLPVNLVAKGLAGDFVCILVFDGVSLAFTALCFWFVAANYKKINTVISTKRMGKTYVLKGEKRRGLFKTLLIREFKLFSSNSSSVVNTLMGGLIAVALSVVFMLKGGISGMFAEADGVMDNYYNLVLSLFPFVPVILVGISNYSSYAISLEGKRLWVLKSLPISPKTILSAKITAAFLLSVPFALAALVFFGIGINVGVLDYVTSVLLITSYTLLCSVFSLFVNMKFNNFDWQSEAEAVKRGPSVLICMLADTLFVLPLIGLQILIGSVSAYLGHAIIIVLLCALCVLFFGLTVKNADQKFKRLG